MFVPPDLLEVDPINIIEEPAHPDSGAIVPFVRPHEDSDSTVEESRQKVVLIDGIKLLDAQVDGITRYLRELLVEMSKLVTEQDSEWQIDVSLDYLGIFSLQEVVDHLQAKSTSTYQVHPLFHTGTLNPIVKSQIRLKELVEAGGTSFWVEKLRLKYHRFRRSCLKKFRRLTRLMTCPAQKYDLCHLALPNTWRHYQSIEAPFLTTVHDLSHLICPTLQTASNNSSLALGLDAARRKDSYYLSVSHSTKEQLINLLDVPGDRIQVVPHAVNHDLFQPESGPETGGHLREKYGLPEEPFFLCLGTIEPRKNLVNTICAFQRLLEDSPHLPVHLIVAGGEGWQNVDELRTAIGSHPKIRCIGYVDDADLSSLYSAALALCYVSRYEGFGLPLVEAMACGTPVIYGDNSSMPEIANGCGVAADVENVESIQSAFYRLATEPTLRKELATNALLKANSLNWEDVASRTLKIYEKIIQSHQTMSLGETATNQECSSHSLPLSQQEECHDAA